MSRTIGLKYIAILAGVATGSPELLNAQPNTREVRVCVVANGALQEVSAVYNTSTGDTTYQGAAWSVAFPATGGYAANATWYINNEPLQINGRRYERYGLPRVVGVNEVSRMAEVGGVPVFAEAGATGTPGVVYVPVRPGCEFQPYQLALAEQIQAGELEAVGLASGPRNAWAVGAQVAYNLGGGEAVDNFQASGRAIIEILGPQSTRFATYLMGNLSRLKTETGTDDPSEAREVQLRELQQSAQGVHLALVPHLFWGDPTNESLTIWASFGWKVNAFAAGEFGTQYLNQGRVAFGGEVSGLQGVGARLPLTLSAEPFVAFFDGDVYERVFGQRETRLAGIDVSLVVPAGEGRGVLFELTAAERSTPSYRVGLLLTSTRNAAELNR